MRSNELPTEYELAEGPEGLMTFLEGLSTKAQQDPEFKFREHYVLYQLGSQKSLIKVDMTQPPYQFTYSDLLGRPATNAVKETIARFLWEKCGEKERYLKELTARGEI